MASTGLFCEKRIQESPQILVERSANVRKVILNRPQKLNALSYEMVLKLLKEFKAFDRDPDVMLVIVKGNGRAFCAGGDAAALNRYNSEGHWSFGTHFYSKQFTLHSMVATYKKPQVFLINGAVMGGGAGLSMNGRFRVVTEKTVFAMPEAAIGLFPDAGASYFLSRLPGFFGEYLGLTGTRIDGAEMLACGLATHFVPSKDLLLLEESLCEANTSEAIAIQRIITQFENQAPIKKESAYRRLDLINKCFSKQSVEEILCSLEHVASNAEDEWISATIKSIKMASPISLKLFLVSIRQGRKQDINECLVREYRMASHVMRRTISNDFYEGTRAKLLDKDNSPKWEPLKLDLVSDIMLEKYLNKVNEDEGWQDLKLPPSTKLDSLRQARL